nr:2Fe-2S iron-sulfur cluster-binding protein [uncultured Holophaga sp.]
MPTIKINETSLTVEPGTLLMDACRQAGFEIPHYCYHPALTPVATCRMCLVEIKGQPKLATSCTTVATEGMEVSTNSPAVAEARGGVMEFLLINHPLDCPICDQAGECRLQDYSFTYGSGDSRMVEPKRRYAYEDLGARIVIDKNRCIHCTRCVRFTQEVSGGGELTVANRGSDLEITTYAGKTLDGNPLAGNVVDLCPVGALTSRDFRFTKRVWYLKPVPTISRHSATASPIWADVDQNRVWRFRPRPEPGRMATHFIFDAERQAMHRYDLDPGLRQRTPLLRGEVSDLEAIARELRSAGPVAVIGQGTFGCNSAEQLARLATEPALCFGSGDLVHPITHPELQTYGDGVFNRRGFSERGFRFGHLEELWGAVNAGQVGSVVLLHDAAFSSARETALLESLLRSVPFSLVLEPIPSSLGALGTACLPVTTYLEESDTVLTHDGILRRYQKALQAPKGVKNVAEWVAVLTR